MCLVIAVLLAHVVMSIQESFRKSAHAMLLALSLLELVVGGLTLAVTVHAVFYCNSYKGVSACYVKHEK